MQIYFYGTTHKEAREKCEKFLDSLFDLKVPEGKELKINSICVRCFSAFDAVYIPKKYKEAVFCAFELVPEGKKEERKTKCL